MEYRLVIIDDEKEISGGFAMFFPWKSIGFTVAAQFSNGREALEFLKEHEVDVIVSDVKMPGMDGLAIAEEIKKMKMKAPPKLVFFSAYGEFAFAQKAMEYGAVKYILKTTPYEELITVFQELKESLDAEAGERLQEENETSENKIMSIIKEYIESHLDTVNLDILAEQVYMSPAYVSRYFKQQTGENFQEYLIARRMEKAAVLLEDIQYQISDISEMVGYRNPFNFSRTFKKYFRENPRDYRMKKLGVNLENNDKGEG